MTIPSPRSRTSSVSSTSSTAPLPSFEQLAPPRPPTTGDSEAVIIPVAGIEDGVRLKVLSRYLAFRHASKPEALIGRTVLELGSGTGLVGIAAALLAPTADVWVTDQAMLLPLMQANSQLNLPLQPHLHVAELNWGEQIPELIPSEEVSVILAADCVYFEPAFPLLVKTLCDLAPVGKAVEILFCWKKRRKADKRFFALLKKHFDSEPVMDDKPGERDRYGREGVSLTRLYRRR